MKHFRYFTHSSVWSLLSVFLMATLLVGGVVIYCASQLPNVESLKHIQLQVPLRVYTADGKLISEYGAKRRRPVTFEQIPKQFVHAVLATEDQRYYEHHGIDFWGLMRAFKNLVETGTKGQGGSTITMQVARNFFLTRKKTFIRKFKELLLALKIDHNFSKDKILELYFNKIYFGNRAYGVAAAADTYYGKKLDQLTLAQMAMLAGLPKSPSTINPLANKEAALDRRHHVLTRMYDLGYIDKQAFLQANAAPVTASYHGLKIQVEAHYVAEMVRHALVKYFGPDVYSMGLNVYTTVDSRLQKQANNSLRTGLLSYDKRHGYRGPEQKFAVPANEDYSSWLVKLKQIEPIAGILPAAVTNVTNNSVQALLASGDTVTLNWAQIKWARKEVAGGEVLGPKLNSARQILTVGDVIRVQQLASGAWQLSQVPKAQGALIAMNPNNGAVDALVGGFSYRTSEFNRATQALRQPGSSFKPFIYSAALAKGYTLASLINDAPIVIHDRGDETLWRPQNDTKQFYGPTRLRVGLMKSRNLVSIRLLQAIQLPYALQYLRNFGFNPDKLPHSLSLALGAGAVAPLDLARGYSVLANGGYLVSPYLIGHITNIHNKIVYQADPQVACAKCVDNHYVSYDDPNLNLAPHTVSTAVSYLMTSALQSVIKSGTGRAALALHRDDLAGKTGTTNDQVDAWFSGYNRDIVTTVWVGFDNPRSLYEYGAQVALPIWVQFMREALQGQPENSLPQPSDIVTSRIDKVTGLLARPHQQDSMFENFREQYAPTHEAPEADEHMNVYGHDQDEPEPLY